MALQDGNGAPVEEPALDGIAPPPKDSDPRRPSKSSRGKSTPRAAAPKAPGDPTPREPGKPGRKSNETKANELRAPLEKLISSGALALGMIAATTGSRNPYLAEQLRYDGSVVLRNSEAVAGELVQLAAEHAGVRRVLESLLSTSSWARTFSVVAAVAIPIASNHGALPPAMATAFGAPEPPAKPARPVASVTPIRGDVPSSAPASSMMDLGNMPEPASPVTVEPASDDDTIVESVNPL